MRPTTPTDTPIERIRHSLVSLRMPRALETLDGVVQQIERGQITPIEAIDKLLAEEITVREGHRIKAALQMARLATVRTLTGFDFSFQPSLDRNRIMALAGLDFIDRHEVVHFIGQSGTGKTHLASALGVEAIRAGRSVYFSPLSDIIDSLAKADREGRLRERNRYLCRAQLLIIGEIGYLALGATAGNLFFQLVNARYERGAMILTSNRGFSEWAEVFGDPVVATALLDCLLHHAVVVHIEGASYRLRQHADLFPEAMRQNGLTQATPIDAPRRRGRPPKHPLTSPSFGPPEAWSKYSGRPSSRPLLSATARRSGQGMKPLAGRGFARPLTAPSTGAPHPSVTNRFCIEGGKFQTPLLGIFKAPLTLHDGRIELDTNTVERAMRPVPLGRKNALLAGSDEGAANWGAIASLIETCKLNGVEPQRYLTEMLTLLVNGWSKTRIDELMPWHCVTTAPC